MNIKNLLLILSLIIAFQSFSQDAKKYTTYVVKPGETIRSIAKKIGCKTREIKDLNPDVDKKNPRVNTTLVVPNKNYGKLIVKDKGNNKQKKVVVHTVTTKETFYGIAKKYNVTIQSIKDANPNIANGLQPGQKIRIPSKDEFTVLPKKGKVVIYKVLKGDTKWRIATLHDISIAELEKINPNLKGELKENDSIWVPSSKKIAEGIKDTYKQKQDSIYIYHVIKQGEGLFRIAVLYNTTQDEIKALNPEATKNLRPGMLLKIPAKKKDNLLTHEVVKGDTFFNLTRKYDISKKELISLNPELKEGLKLGSVIRINPPNKSNENYLVDSISIDKNIHLSFLMPLMADKKVDYNSKKESQLRNICTDFYMGAEIAIDSLQKQGMNITYHVYDTKNNPIELYNLLDNNDLHNSDAIIGPFFFGNAQKIAKELRDIPVLSPLYSKKQNTDDTDNLVKTAADRDEMNNTLVNYLKKKYQKEKVIIVVDTNKVNILTAKNIKKQLNRHDSISSITLIEPSRNKKKPEEIYMNKKLLQESVDEKRDMWVILVSDDNIVTSDIVNTYGVLASDSSIRLFSTKEFDTYEHLDYQYLGQLSWSFPATQFGQLNTEIVKKFNEKYLRLNHKYPTDYSFTGFDLTYDTLIRLSSNGNLIKGLEAGISNRLSHQYIYEDTPNGFFNKGVLMISFNKDMEFELLE